MPGQPGKVQLADELFLLAPGRNEALEVNFHGAIIRAPLLDVKKRLGARRRKSSGSLP
jgi:hypothetical protein